jgi:DNA transformation protein
MQPPPPFVEHCVELLAPLGPVRTRRMFGGHGMYLDELFIAIVTGERLYLKVDDDTRPSFERAGCEPFSFEARQRRVVLGYWSVPPEAIESPALMAPWARLALQAALRARQADAGRPAKGRKSGLKPARKAKAPAPPPATPPASGEPAGASAPTRPKRARR